MKKLEKRHVRCWAAGALLLFLVPMCGCSFTTKRFGSISQEEAMGIMASGSDCMIVDVRTQEEYEESHIPGAVLVPIEDIRKGKLDQLPDKNQELLLYCRTGRRAEDAARILVEAGYTNVKEFGGILTWKGDVVSGVE